MFGRVRDNEFAAQEEKADLAVRMTTLSQQVDLCMRLCRRCVTGTSCTSQDSSPAMADARLVLPQLHQVWELLKVHSLAISRTWHWTASLVNAARGTSVLPQNGAVPPPLPPAGASFSCE
eukprot:1762831-Amphidinium_carterae.1